jgi:hypothetical protein
VEELKLTDLAQRAKIEDLTTSASQKDLLVDQLNDNVAALNDTIKGISPLLSVPLPFSPSLPRSSFLILCQD